MLPYMVNGGRSAPPQHQQQQHHGFTLQHQPGHVLPMIPHSHPTNLRHPPQSRFSHAHQQAFRAPARAVQRRPSYNTANPWTAVSVPTSAAAHNGHDDDYDDFDSGHYYDFGFSAVKKTSGAKSDGGACNSVRAGLTHHSDSPAGLSFETGERSVESAQKLTHPAASAAATTALVDDSAYGFALCDIVLTPVAAVPVRTPCGGSDSSSSSAESDSSSGSQSMDLTAAGAGSSTARMGGSTDSDYSFDIGGCTTAHGGRKPATSVPTRTVALSVFPDQVSPGTGAATPMRPRGSPGAGQPPLRRQHRQQQRYVSGGSMQGQFPSTPSAATSAAPNFTPYAKAVVQPAMRRRAPQPPPLSVPVIEDAMNLRGT